MLYKKRNFKPIAHKTAFWYVSGVVLKISDEHPPPFYMGVPYGGEFFTQRNVFRKSTL